MGLNENQFDITSLIQLELCKGFSYTVCYVHSFYSQIIEDYNIEKCVPDLERSKNSGVIP